MTANRLSTATDTWSLWSTTATLVVTEPRRLSRARTVADRILADIDLAANRFRPDSEICGLGPGPDGWVELSPTLAGLLARALYAATLSGGSVDPTVGATMADLGYDRDLYLVLRDGAPARAVVRPVCGWQRLRLEDRRLRLPTGVVLDLGATAKAAAADRCATEIATTCDTGVLVGLGGDIATAGPAPRGGWQVAVRDLATEPGTQVRLAPGTAVATSSTARRRWRAGGAPRHHIVDPLTSRPAESPWRSVTVVGTSCVEANTASTACIAKASAGSSWLAGTGLPARLVDHDNSVVTLGAWPRDTA